MTQAIAKAAVAESPEETQAQQAETFAEFAKSFSYGSRTDLLFKFIKNLPEDQAGEFFRELLDKLGETLDDGNLERLAEHVYQWNVRGYEHAAEDRWQYDNAPFSRLAKPLAQSRLALVTTTGHFVEGDDPSPFGITGMTQAEAASRIQDFLKLDPVLSKIPVDTPPEKLHCRQPGIDIRAYEKDRNVALPLDRLREFEAEGVIGELLPDAFSFAGTSSVMSTLKKHAPKWVDMLKEREVDAVLMVPV